MEEFLPFNATWPWPWPWIGPYAHRRASLIDPYIFTYQISLRLDENFSKVTSQFFPSSKTRDTETRKDIRSHLPAPLKMAEEIDFENGRISNFQQHVNLNLTFDLATCHTVVHQLSTSTYVHTKFHSKRWNFCGRTYVRTYERTDKRTDIEAGFIRSTRKILNTFEVFRPILCKALKYILKSIYTFI